MTADEWLRASPAWLHNRWICVLCLGSLWGYERQFAMGICLECDWSLQGRGEEV